MRDEIDVDCVNNAMNSLIRDCQDFQAENAALKAKVENLTAHNNARDEICACKFIDKDEVDMPALVESGWRYCPSCGRKLSPVA